MKKVVIYLVFLILKVYFSDYLVIPQNFNTSVNFLFYYFKKKIK